MNDVDPLAGLVLFVAMMMTMKGGIDQFPSRDSIYCDYVLSIIPLATQRGYFLRH